MRWILIRHGKTRGNLEKRYIGCRTDEPLTPEGAEQLRQGQYPPVGRVYASPMRRCLETAEILYPGVPKETVPDLRECDFGDFEGKNYAELNGDPQYQSWIDSGGTKDFPGGEKRDAFIHRSMQGFRAALGDIEISERVIILCHGGTIMAIMSALTGKDTYDFMVGNLEGYILDLEMNDEGIHVISYNRLVFGRSA